MAGRRRRGVFGQDVVCVRPTLTGAPAPVRSSKTFRSLSAHGDTSTLGNTPFSSGPLRRIPLLLTHQCDENMMTCTTWAASPTAIVRLLHSVPGRPQRACSIRGLHLTVFLVGRPTPTETCQAGVDGAVLDLLDPGSPAVNCPLHRLLNEHNAKWSIQRRRCMERGWS